MEKNYEERRMAIINKNNLRKQEIYKEVEILYDVLRNNGYIDRVIENEEDRKIKEELRQLGRELEMFRLFKDKTYLFHLSNYE